MAHIRSVGPWSVMKLFALLYAMIGFLIGAVISLISVLGFMGTSAAGTEGAWAFLFGTAAIVIAPIFYGCIGAVGGLIMSLFYNLAAGITGGLEINLQ